MPPHPIFLNFYKIGKSNNVKRAAVPQSLQQTPQSQHDNWCVQPGAHGHDGELKHPSAAYGRLRKALPTPRAVLQTAKESMAKLSDFSTLRIDERSTSSRKTDSPLQLLQLFPGEISIDILGMNRSFSSSSSPTSYTDFLKDLLVKFSSPWQGNVSAEPVSCLIEIHCQVDSFDGKEVAFRPVKQLSSLKP
uniref:Uncharacterized protein n=1 Tax=Myotis myotis TaxID=51298 RepID=A0A7J7UPS0_MYOMY|nr:hypothetical protein mMyoMyo1_008658 [Myotis myotis]